MQSFFMRPTKTLFRLRGCADFRVFVGLLCEKVYFLRTYLQTSAPRKDSDQTPGRISDSEVCKVPSCGHEKFLHADNKDSVQKTARMRSFRVFVGCTCKKVHFLT